MKPIVVVPNTVLTSPAQEVTIFGSKLQKLLEDMEETLRATDNPKGVGLAAPQIGEPLKIFLTKPKESAPVRAFINPVIVSTSNDAEWLPDDDKRLEGCLSIPAIWGKVKRHTSVTLKYQDPQGKEHRETFKGFVATIIQHETDHINGILYSQRVLEQKGTFYQAKQDEKGKEILEEITLI